MAGELVTPNRVDGSTGRTPLPPMSLDRRHARAHLEFVQAVRNGERGGT